MWKWCKSEWKYPVLRTYISGWLLSKRGRRLGMLLFSIPIILGYASLVLAYYTDMKALLYLGRLLTGKFNPKLTIKFCCLTKQFSRPCLPTLKFRIWRRIIHSGITHVHCGSGWAKDQGFSNVSFHIDVDTWPCVCGSSEHIQISILGGHFWTLYYTSW